MRTCFLLFFTIHLSLLTLAQADITLRLKSLPAYHIPGSPIYLAGSFNNWNPGDANYKFSNGENGYSIHLKLPAGKYEYKLTRGGWDRVECNPDGSGIGNRTLEVNRETIISLDVAAWQDHFPSAPKKSSASKNVCILDTAFVIPQLSRTRRVWIYLPEDYCDGNHKKYPVLYLNDGQNLFDDATSFSGEWGIDEFLDTTSARKCIVVAVDHGNGKRMNEYNPYDNERFGKGEGDLYADFIVQTLKPFIDREYRTLRKRDNTFIAGSSMGGLISMYTVLKYPKVFGGVGIFSPAFWISGEKIYDDIREKGNKVKAKLYFYGGKMEGERMVPDMLKAFTEMAKVSKSKMTTVIRDEGKHNEPTWRKEFPLFYEWIMK